MKTTKLILPLVFIIIFFTCCNDAGKDKIVIGAILPLTGDAAPWGDAPMKAAQLAVEEINNVGGINGKMIELIVEDGGCDPQMGVAAVNKLISANKPIAIVGAVCSGNTLAIAPIVEKNKIVLISPASTQPSISEAGDYIFRVIPSDEYRTKVFAEYIASEGYKNIGMIYINNEPGKSAEQNFIKYFKENGGEVVISEGYLPDATEVKTQLTKIRNSKPELLLALSQVNDAVIVLRNAKELNIDIPIYFLSEAIDDPTVVENAGDAIEGVTYITFAEADNTVNKHFEEAFKNKYGIEPATFAPEAYDAVYILSKTLGSLDDQASEDFVQALYGIKDFEGASGIITFNKDGDVLKPLAIKKINQLSPQVITVK